MEKHPKNISDDVDFRELIERAGRDDGKAAAVESVFKGEERRDRLAAKTVLEKIATSGIHSLPKNVLEHLDEEELPLLGDRLFDLFEYSRSDSYGAGANLWFSPSPIIQSAIPVSEPEAGVTQYHSVNGEIETTLSVPIEGGREFSSGLAYGIPGRLALAYLTTACLRSETGKISLTGYRSRLVENEFGRTATKGKRGAVNRYPDSIESWVKTTIQLTSSGSFDIDGDEEGQRRRADGVYYKTIPVATNAFLWSSEGFDRKSGGWIEFSPQFQKFSKEHAVPIEYEVLSRVADLKSPHAYDLFYWCVWRVDAMQRSGQTLTRLSWDQLHKQLLPQYKVTADAVTEVLTAIQTLKNKAGITLPVQADRKRGLILYRSAKPIVGSVARKAPSI